jgi:hypothetical protein
VCRVVDVFAARAVADRINVRRVFAAQHVERRCIVFDTEGGDSRVAGDEPFPVRPLNFNSSEEKSLLISGR